MGAIAPTRTENRVKSLRERLGLTQRVAARLLGVTERTIAILESSGDVSESIARRLTEIERLCSQLAKVMRRDRIGAWLSSPNKAFDDMSPVDVIAAGKMDRIWRMIYELRSGAPS